MLYKNYFNMLIVILFSLTLSPTAISAAFEEKCGNDTFQVKILNGMDLYEKKYELYYKEVNKKYRLIYQTDSGVFFYIGCLQNTKKQNIILFQEYCFGNGCPEAVYGIFDLSTKKMLIQPSNWPQGNIKKVESILGFSPPILNEDNGSSFCCSNTQDKS